MNAELARAIRGPIILITIGVLFAIDHAGVFPFERTWPVLIIAIGVMKLLERGVAVQQPAYPPYSGLGGPQFQSSGYQPGYHQPGYQQPGQAYQTPPPVPQQPPAAPANPNEPPAETPEAQR